MKVSNALISYLPPAPTHSLRFNQEPNRKSSHSSMSRGYPPICMEKAVNGCPLCAKHDDRHWKPKDKSTDIPSLLWIHSQMDIKRLLK